MQLSFGFILFMGLAGGSCLAAVPTQYNADGTPTGLEEEIRWRVNRGRFDAASENQTRGTAYTDVSSTAGPLAPNQSLTLAACHQSEDLAKHNLFQHETVPGSAYYNSTTQPEPWDRMAAEGYSWNYAGENIAAGYSGAEAAYVGWWNSTGHRENMYNSAFREIGNGYFYWSSSAYRSYYTMDLGNSGNSCFLTDTLFSDANANGLYDQGEGVPGVYVTLVVGGVTYSNFDISTAVGSFALPIQSITAAAAVQVVLSNTSAASITMSIPRDYRTYTKMTLAPAEGRVFGMFNKPAGARNISFREVMPVQLPIVSPKLDIAPSGRNVLLTWHSETGLQYLPQRTLDLLVWTNLSAGYQPGTGGNMSWQDSVANVGNRRFYRLLVSRP